MLHDAAWCRVVAWAAVIAGVAAACLAPAERPPPAGDRRPAWEVAFSQWERAGSASEEVASRVRVLVVNEAGAPLPGAEVACHAQRTRTAADGRAECDVRAPPSAWPVYVRVLHGERFGQQRTAGGGAEVRVVARPPVTLQAEVSGAWPRFGQLTLVVDDANGELELPLDGPRLSLPGRPAVRTFFRVVHDFGDRSADLATAVSEEGEPVRLVLGQPGAVEFTATVGGDLLPAPRVWVDRIARTPRVGVGPRYVVALPPGDHVMVLNHPTSRARAEVKFHVVSGETTPLGPLALE